MYTHLHGSSIKFIRSPEFRNRPSRSWKAVASLRRDHAELLTFYTLFGAMGLPDRVVKTSRSGSTCVTYCFHSPMTCIAASDNGILTSGTATSA
jgi:hypothetical protein